MVPKRYVALGSKLNWPERAAWPLPRTGEAGSKILIWTLKEEAMEMLVDISKDYHRTVLIGKGDKTQNCPSLWIYEFFHKPTRNKQIIITNKIL